MSSTIYTHNIWFSSIFTEERRVSPAAVMKVSLDCLTESPSSSERSPGLRNRRSSTDQDRVLHWVKSLKTYLDSIDNVQNTVISQKKKKRLSQPSSLMSLFIFGVMRNSRDCVCIHNKCFEENGSCACKSHHHEASMF